MQTVDTLFQITHMILGQHAGGCFLSLGRHRKQSTYNEKGTLNIQKHFPDPLFPNERDKQPHMAVQFIYFSITIQSDVKLAYA